MKLNTEFPVLSGIAFMKVTASSLVVKPLLKSLTFGEDGMHWKIIYRRKFKSVVVLFNWK